MILPLTEQSLQRMAVSVYSCPQLLGKGKAIKLAEKALKRLTVSIALGHSLGQSLNSRATPAAEKKRAGSETFDWPHPKREQT